jgi:hypothetical protein
MTLAINEFPPSSKKLSSLPTLGRIQQLPVEAFQSDEETVLAQIWAEAFDLPIAHKVNPSEPAIHPEGLGYMGLSAAACWIACEGGARRFFARDKEA